MKEGRRFLMSQPYVLFGNIHAEILNYIYNKKDCYDKKYFRYIKAITIINSDIHKILEGSIDFDKLYRKIKNLPKNKIIIINDQRGLVFDHILKFIDGRYGLKNYKISVASKYLYPKHIASKVLKPVPAEKCYPDWYIIDTSKFIIWDSLKKNINKIDFLLMARDELIKEAIKISYDAKQCESSLKTLINSFIFK